MAVFDEILLHVPGKCDEAESWAAETQEIKDQFPQPECRPGIRR